MLASKPNGNRGNAYLSAPIWLNELICVSDNRRDQNVVYTPVQCFKIKWNYLIFVLVLTIYIILQNIIKFFGMWAIKFFCPLYISVLNFYKHIHREFCLVESAKPVPIRWCFELVFYIYIQQLRFVVSF